MSPDGTSVYVASPAASSITRFVRSGLLGNLAFGGCHANNAVDGCTDLPGSPLDGLRGLAASPDGRSVYATAVTMRSITHFVRDTADGRLDLGTCMAGEELAECRPLPAFPLTGAAGVAVSPDGASVYVASSGAGSISRFSRQVGVPLSPP
jgi:DNA-binding beta-propeller fold protein YncE